MKIEIGNWKFETPVKLLIGALTAVVLAAIYFATASFQSLEMSAHFNLQSRQLPSTSTNLTLSTISTVIP